MSCVILTLASGSWEALTIQLLMDEQIPFFHNVQLADNPEPRCPCVVVLDVSSSMSGAAIEALNRGVGQFIQELSADSLASRRVEVAIVTFGSSVQLAADFTSPRSLIAPHFTADGATPMGEAVVRAYSVLESRKEEYRRAGISYFRPWMFLLTDGEPTDTHSKHWKDAIRLVHEGEADKRLLFFGVAVNDADQAVLNALCPPKRPSLKLKGLHFGELFSWLTASLKSASASAPGSAIKLPPTSGWASIEV